MNYISINGILHSGKLHVCVAIIRKAKCVNRTSGIIFRHTTAGHKTCRFRDQIAMIVIPFNLQTQQFKGVQIYNTQIILAPVERPCEGFNITADMSASTSQPHR